MLHMKPLWELQIRKSQRSELQLISLILKAKTQSGRPNE